MKYSHLALFGAAMIGAALPSAAQPLPGQSPVAMAPPPAAPVPDDIPVALVIDLSTGQTLFSRDPDRRFMPASVTKVMSLYTAFHLIGDHKLSPDTVVTVTKDIGDHWSGKGSSMLLKTGDRVTVGELLLGISTVSGNDAAVMLATYVAGSIDGWVALMNANAAQLGMRNSHFGMPNGWMDEGRTYFSARDLAVLASAMVTRYPDLYHRFVGHHRMTYNNITQVNHDPITGVVPGADGIKTGYTRQAGYTFVGSAERDGRRLVLVIAGAPTPIDRNRTARDLIEWGFAAFQTRQLVPDDAEVGRAAVQGGADRQVALRTDLPVLASVPPDGVLPKPTLTIRYRGPLQAPLKQGQQVAELHVAIAGQQPHDVPLAAANHVSRADFLQRLRNGLLGLL